MLQAAAARRVFPRGRAAAGARALVAFWERNYFATAFPGLHELLRNNYVRGAVSGLGVVNLLMGFDELASVLWRAAAWRPMETLEQS